MDQAEALALFNNRRKGRKFYTIEPHPFQKEVLAGGSMYLKRMLMAGNRVGKTFIAAYEVAVHATGLYPDWWEGKRYNHAPLIWVSSLSNETLRDIIQLELLGKIGEFGTGMVPEKLLIDWDFRQAGIKGVVDSFRVRHVTGEKSVIKTKVAEQGWEKYQGTAPDFFWQDEEPDDFRIISESFIRLMTTNGSFLLTFTPLKGESLIVQHFMEENKANRHIYTATWDDAKHLDEKTKKAFLDEVPQHEKLTRTKGIPMMGEGAVFPISDEAILCKPFPIPDHFALICGVDFGVNHPAAAVWLAIDRDTQTTYLVNAYKKAHELPSFHASVIKKQDPDSHIPVVWPHDGINEEKSSGENVAKSYQAEGVRMFPFSARYDDKVGSTQKIEPIVQELYDEMVKGRFKVFDNAGGQLFLQEKRGLHRKDGKIKAIHDDIFAATRYAKMMSRYAIPKYLARSAPSYNNMQPLVSSSQSR